MDALKTYYNENDKFAAAWLRNLMAAGLISEGVVDERDIRDVRPDDLRGFGRCHFFAGIGGWDYALKLAEWGNSAVWTGSCPCQPFSGAGSRKGANDARHLWPAFWNLITNCRPPVVFGEQVASRDGRLWLAGVRADLEVVGYAVGAADLCAASVGSPHVRQRLYWVADADGRNAESEWEQRGGQQRQQPQDCSDANWLARSNSGRQSSSSVNGKTSRIGSECAKRVVDAKVARLQREWSEYRPSGERHGGLVGFAMQTGVPQWNGPTVAAKCADGARRVSAQPDSFPLAHGVPARMGRLRAYGNAIIPQVAEKFIRAYLRTT